LAVSTAERRVAARAAAAGHVVLHLGFFGQREEALERIVGAIDVAWGCRGR
jgi:hypothetical protein